MEFYLVMFYLQDAWVDRMSHIVKGIVNFLSFKGDHKATYWFTFLTEVGISSFTPFHGHLLLSDSLIVIAFSLAEQLFYWKFPYISFISLLAVYSLVLLSITTQNKATLPYQAPAMCQVLYVLYLIFTTISTPPHCYKFSIIFLFYK